MSMLFHITMESTLRGNIHNRTESLKLVDQGIHITEPTIHGELVSEEGDTSAQIRFPGDASN